MPDKLRRALKAIYYYGKRNYCPCCDHRLRRFIPMFGRTGAMCPVCGAMERHRLVWLYLINKTNLLHKSICILHLAPEDALFKRISNLPNVMYLTGDLSSPKAKTIFDITNMPFRENRFDCLICCHLLEHVPEDLKAMEEMFRVLKHGGWALFQHPIDCNREQTFEDLNVVAPKDREKIFGQKDHVRIYGKDIKARLESAGFVVRIQNYIEEFEEQATQKYGLKRDEIIYFCEKS